MSPEDLYDLRTLFLKSRRRRVGGGVGERRCFLNMSKSVLPQEKRKPRSEVHEDMLFKFSWKV